jgi:hypothetical protein
MACSGLIMTKGKDVSLDVVVIRDDDVSFVKQQIVV